jgi:class 3 adenylate cyclase
MGEESLPAFVLGDQGVTEQRIQRRLAAILAADVAGYSRLVGADEEGTLDRTRAIRADRIDPKIHEHRARIVLGWGGEAEHAIE